MIMIEFPARCALATPCISHKARQIGFPAITESRKHKKSKVHIFKLNLWYRLNRVKYFMRQ